MRSLPAIALFALLALTPAASAADPARIALVSLCDPAKIATLTSDRAAAGVGDDEAVVFEVS